jgi:glycerol-1-phosphate dehydrogenase [NAD(P)+]
MLRTAGDTRLLHVERAARHASAGVFAGLWGQRPAMIVADANTFAAAGRDVVDSFRRGGQPCVAPFLFPEHDLRAEYHHVGEIERALKTTEAIAVAVGAGTINDLSKLASHQLGQSYMVVATAASMDGYAAFGASIVHEGAKQSFPAPAAILADLEVIEAAPAAMNAWGYADLLAKLAAGADWLLADALAVEPIHAEAWNMVQGRLRQQIADPAGIRSGDSAAIRRLFCGLIASGLAMQCSKSSRPASGAEHQFSHLWDTQCHTHLGTTPPHGFKVGIGTLASVAMYEQILSLLLEDLDVERSCATWPPLKTILTDVARKCDRPELATMAIRETQAKYVDVDQLRLRLERLRDVWPSLRQRLQTHLMSWDELRDRLDTAGCPTRPEQIGISATRLRESYAPAYHIRRRFTVLDLAAQTGLFESLLERIFSTGGRWPLGAE